MTIRPILATVALAVLITGCEAPPPPEPVLQGDPITSESRARIRPDHSTVADVERLFGKPQQKVTHSDGREQWVYAWGWIGEGEGRARVQTLSIVFELGLVARVEFNDPDEPDRSTEDE